MAKTKEVLGYTVYFNRRRYGNTTYTWAYIDTGHEKGLSLGDPWPCVTPKKSELEQAISNALTYEKELLAADCACAPHIGLCYPCQAKHRVGLLEQAAA